MAFCTECGSDIPAGMRFCTGCGSAVVVSGAALADSPQPQAPQPVVVPPPAISMAPQAPAQPPVASQQVQQAQPPKPVVPSARRRVSEPAPAKGSRYAVMGTGAFFGLILLFCIPVIGWVACVIMAFASGNQNRKNFARAMLIFIIIGILLSVAVYFVAGWVFEVLVEYAAESAKSGLSGLSG